MGPEQKVTGTQNLKKQKIQNGIEEIIYNGKIQ